MQDDLAPVGDLVDEVNRGPRHLHALFQGRLMHPQPVEALAAKRRDQGRVDVEDAPGVAGGEGLAENAHEARQHDDVDAVCFHLVHDGLFKGRLTAALLFQNDAAVHPGVFRPGEGVGVRLVGNHQHDFAAFDLAVLLRVKDGL